MVRRSGDRTSTRRTWRDTIVIDYLFLCPRTTECCNLKYEFSRGEDERRGGGVPYFPLVFLPPALLFIFPPTFALFTYVPALPTFCSSSFQSHHALLRRVSIPGWVDEAQGAGRRLNHPQTPTVRCFPALSSSSSTTKIDGPLPCGHIKQCI